MAHTISTKYNPATGKITAKCWNGSIRIDGYDTKAAQSDLKAHREAAEALLQNKLNADKEGGEWTIIAAAEGIKANEYTFIIDYIVEPGARKEYLVTWSIDVMADSYKDAARWTQDTFFAQGSQMSFEVRPRDVANPITIDFTKE